MFGIRWPPLAADWTFVEVHCNKLKGFIRVGSSYGAASQAAATSYNKLLSVDFDLWVKKMRMDLLEQEQILISYRNIRIICLSFSKTK